MKLINSDCLVALKLMADNSVDSLITDPPAGISFMGKAWDEDKGGRKQWVAWMSEVMSECMRVLKPGAHGLVWAIPRTSHWTATALEDAGFEIRDVVTHIFGSGFPKSMDISKAIDKQAGAEREVIGPSKRHGGGTNLVYGAGMGDGAKTFETAPSTDGAKQWAGWGTALKPASEHWVLVRKPISAKTVAANVLEHGTGGINIDVSRIGTEEKLTSGRHIQANRQYTSGYKDVNRTEYEQNSAGRFPANLVLSHNEDCLEVNGTVLWQDKNEGVVTRKDGSEVYLPKAPSNSVLKSGDKINKMFCTDACAVAALDEQSGILKSGARKGPNNINSMGERVYGKYAFTGGKSEASEGGASRFFYIAKASKKDKGSDNTHPTVKSSSLMSYLIKLITPPGGIILDPFMGSGSTGVAAIKEGFDFIGIEKETEYFEICEKRIK